MKKRLRISGLFLPLSAAVLLCVGCGVPAPPVDHEDLETELQAVLDGVRRDLELPGVTAAVVLPGGGVIALASGYDDLERRIEMRPESRLLAGSIGKTFVAAAVLDLANNGVLALDDPLSRWLGHEDWFSRLPNAEAITLRMLLTHSSGIPDHVYDPLFAQRLAASFTGSQADPDMQLSPPELIEYVLDDEPLRSAGDGYAYSDTGYILLGLVIERAAGRRFYDYVEERFVGPLDLRRTSPSDRRDLQDLAAGYVGPNDPFGVGERKVAEGGLLIFNPASEWTGGGFVSTSQDLAHWARELYEGRALDGDYLEELLAGVPTDDGRSEYGLGVSIDTTALGPRYGHGGVMIGYNSRMDYYPRYGFALAAQVNTIRGDRAQVRDAVLDPLAETVARHLDGGGETARVFASSTTRDTPIFSYEQLHQPVLGQNGMVVAQNHLASAVGADILRRGGNAMDAAVATGFALAVTLPRAGNLGGGGFMTVWLAEEQRAVVIDYRETAPLLATPDDFLDENGMPDEDLKRRGAKSVAVPGSVAGFELVHERYGSLPWADLLEPAVALAAEGFTVTPYLADTLIPYTDWLTEDAATAQVLYPGGQPLAVGDTLVQADLAETLRRIRDQGKDGFYQGEVADRIVAEMVAGNGLITHEDLAEYRAVVRDAVHGNYRGHDIYSVAPPSAGGVTLIQMLNLLERFPLSEMGSGGARSIHVMTEAMKLAYADRSRHVADPAFVHVPVNGLTSKSYADALADGIDPEGRARTADEINPGDPLPYEGPDTTHFSIADAHGNLVSNTYTLNYSFGSGLIADGTGVLLNNQMDDFVLDTTVPNSYGLLGPESSRVQGGKRPVSSMTPTVVIRDGDPYLALGTPGGSHITTAVLQILVNVIDHDLNIAEAIHRPRFHHQWRPDTLLLEQGFSPDTIGILESRGHIVEILDWASCSVQAVMLDGGLFFGGADPRRPDARAVGVNNGPPDSG